MRSIFLSLFYETWKRCIICEILSIVSIITNQPRKPLTFRQNWRLQRARRLPNKHTDNADNGISAAMISNHQQQAI